MDESDREFLKEIYASSGYRTIFTSTYENTGIDDIMKAIEGKTTVFAGPSGVGKVIYFEYYYARS